MASAARSTPPPAAAPQTRAKFLRAEDLLERELSSLTPAERAARLALAEALDVEMRRSPPISNTEVGEALSVLPNVVARWRSARAPIPLSKLSLLPPHSKARIWSALGVVFLQLRHR